MDSIQDKIDDIVEAGSLEIELKFISFQTRMSVINAKSYILDLLAFYDENFAVVINVLENEDINQKHKEELISYAHELYKRIC